MITEPSKKMKAVLFGHVQIDHQDRRTGKHDLIRVRPSAFQILNGVVDTGDRVHLNLQSSFCQGALEEQDVVCGIVNQKNEFVGRRHFPKGAP